MLRLVRPTDARYVDVALNDVDALLIDHAHCEHKAAVTALSFVSKYPDDPVLVRSLSALARDEAGHFAHMVELCHARGLTLGHPGKDEYVAALLSLVRKTSLVTQRIDRLLVCAFVEARSCERLQMLARGFAERGDDIPGGRELAAVYDELWRAEAEHHVLFVELAARAGDVEERLVQLAAHESDVVARLPLRAAIH